MTILCHLKQLLIRPLVALHSRETTPYAAGVLQDALARMGFNV
jgi:hypothetical protein